MLETMTAYEGASLAPRDYNTLPFGYYRKVKGQVMTLHKVVGIVTDHKQMLKMKEELFLLKGEYPLVRLLTNKRGEKAIYILEND